MPPASPPQIVDRKTVYTAAKFHVDEFTVIRSNGRFRRAAVVHGGAVALLPVAADGRFVLVRQFRHSIGETLLEVCAGTLEKGEDPAVCADRELREETGFQADKLTHIGAIYSAPGFCTEKLHCYLAEGLHPAPLPPDADEQIELVHLTAAEFAQKIASGEICDAKTLSCWAFLQVYRPAR
ncbi:MAG TPA: NUDIX hydrolase [Planctomycetota bacterium]|nr:NUDIX hydrolase [Planctomycetota bacterium]